jgi:membrane-associated phospholipid phosphatase
MVSEWMHTLYGAIRVERLSPPVASRLMAYASAALYTGLAAATPGMPRLERRLNEFPNIDESLGRRLDPTLTSVAAERVVLDSLLREALPTTRAAIGRLADSLAQVRAALVQATDVRAASETTGRAIGRAIVAWARRDGFDSTRTMAAFVPPIGDAFWVNDAPANTYAAQNLSGASEFVALDNPANVLRAGSVSDRGLILNRPKRAAAKTLPAVNMAGTSEPYWARLRPFVLRAWRECPVPDPPSYSTDTSSVLYRDAAIVHATGSRLTSEQRAIALYWADNAGESGTPVGHWLSIASQIVSERHLSAEDAARVMLLTSVAQADAFIATWGYKYTLTLIRPRTYIRRVIDSTWEPLIPTPPFPEYPSGHSTVSAAAATVLAGMLGDGAFDDSTGLTIGNAVRRFDSFTGAAREAGLSRIYGGIHFPYGNLGGRALGECIGAKVIERLAAPTAR